MRYWIVLAAFALAVLATATATADTHELELAPSVTNLTLLPGKSATVRISIENQGDVTEQLTYDFTGGNWQSEFLNPPDELEPGEDDNFFIRLTAPETPAGELTRATVTVSNATAATIELNLTVGWRLGAEFSGPSLVNTTDGLAGYAQFQLNSTSNGVQSVTLEVVSGEVWQWRVQPMTWELKAGGSMAVALDWMPPRGTLAETVSYTSLTARAANSTIAEWHFDVAIVPRDELTLDANSTFNAEAGKRLAVPFTVYNYGNRPLLTQVTADVPTGWSYQSVNVGPAPAQGANGELRLTVPRNANGLTTITLHARAVDSNLTVNLTIEVLVRPPPDDESNLLPCLAVGAIVVIGVLVLLGQRQRQRRNATGADAADDEMVVDDKGDEWESTKPSTATQEGDRRARDDARDDEQADEETSPAQDEDPSESAFAESRAKPRRRPSGLVQPVRLKCPGCGRRISVTRSDEEQMTECLWCSATVVVRRKRNE